MNDLASCHIDFHQDDIIADFANISPRDDIIPVPKYAAEPTVPWHDNGVDMPLAFI